MLVVVVVAAAVVAVVVIAGAGAGDKCRPTSLAENRSSLLLYIHATDHT